MRCKRYGSAVAIALVAMVVLTGCATTEISIREFTFSGVAGGKLEGGRVYYAEVSGNVNTPGMGAVMYKNEKPDSHGRELVVIASGVSEQFWKSVILALVQAGGRVAAAGVYGLSLEAAKTAVTQIASPTQTGGGAKAETGKVDVKAEGGAGGSGTGGTGGKSCTSGTTSGGTFCP